MALTLAVHRPTQAAAWPFSRQGGWTAALLLCLAVGLADASLSLLSSWFRPGRSLGAPVAMGLLLGATVMRALSLGWMLALALFAQRWLGSSRTRYALALLLAVLLGTAGSWLLFEFGTCSFARALGYESRYAAHCSGGPPLTAWWPLLAARQLQYAVLVVGLVSFVALARHAQRRGQQAGLRRLALERELALGQARLLQAQIEPHFLFNTLAHVRRLLRTDTAAADAMLTGLRSYLQQSLPRLRQSEVTLAEEMDLVRAYLELHAVRMGARLRYDIQLPAALRAERVPPMLLLTLVENAIKHGLQPVPEGGHIQVAAELLPAGLRLSVADTGRGMTQTLGHGMGLLNVRRRLQALHGNAASLTLQLNQPRGLCASISLPRGAARR